MWEVGWGISTSRITPWVMWFCGTLTVPVFQILEVSNMASGRFSDVILWGWSGSETARLAMYLSGHLDVANSNGFHKAHRPSVVVPTAKMRRWYLHSISVSSLITSSWLDTRLGEHLRSQIFHFGRERERFLAHCRYSYGGAPCFP